MMTTLLIVISFLGSKWWIGVITIAIMIYRHNLKFGLIVVGGLIIGEVLKRIVAEPRPVGMLVTENSWAFPSGHSLNSMVFYSLLWMEWKKYKYSWLVLVMPIIIGLSRIGLGVHYWWDVLVGWILGAGWVSVFRKQKH